MKYSINFCYKAYLLLVFSKQGLIVYNVQIACDNQSERSEHKYTQKCSMSTCHYTEFRSTKVQKTGVMCNSSLLFSPYTVMSSFQVLPHPLSLSFLHVFFIQSKKIMSNILQNKLKYFISSFFALFLRTFFLRMLNTPMDKGCSPRAYLPSNRGLTGSLC